MFVRGMFLDMLTYLYKMGFLCTSLVMPGAVFARNQVQLALQLFILYIMENCTEKQLHSKICILKFVYKVLLFTTVLVFSIFPVSFLICSENVVLDISTCTRISYKWRMEDDW